MVPTVHASLATAALAGVLALAAAADFALLAGGLAIVILIFALGALRSAKLVGDRPIAWLAAAAGLVSLAWTFIDESAEVVPVVSVLGPTLVAAIVIQLVRRDGRPGLTSALSASVAATALVVLPVLWLAMRAVDDVGAYTVELGLLGVGFTAVLEAVPISRAVRRVVGVVLAAAIASALGFVVSDIGDEVPPVSAMAVAAFAGLMTAVAFAVVDRIADEVPSRPQQVRVTVPDDGVERAPDTSTQTGSAASVQPALTSLRISLPFIAAAPAIYVLGRLLIELPS